MIINKEKIRDLFVSLVEIDSPSGQEEKVADFIIKRLKKSGYAIEKDSYGNVVVRINGKGKPLMLVAHMDTVEPGRGIKAKIRGDVIMSEGKTILGADDKAGIAEIISALEYVKEQGIGTRPLEIVFTREEETGLCGAANLDLKKLKARECIVMDKSGGEQIVVIAAPFISSIQIEAIGKAAHSSTPEKGINALRIATGAISKLKLGRIDSETTFNIGIMNVGEVTNVIPDLVSIKAEVRSHDRQKMEILVGKIKEVFQDEAGKYKGKIKFKASLGCYGYKHEKNDPFVRGLVENWKSMGKTASLEKVGGASDANEFSRKGIKAVDIGYGGINPHSKDESIRVSSMQIIAEFLVETIRIK